MIVMEGLMLVPPERGTIIGRALWKVGIHEILGSSPFLLTFCLSSLDMSS